jgi:hypothetical protein
MTLVLNCKPSIFSRIILAGIIVDGYYSGGSRLSHFLTLLPIAQPIPDRIVLWCWASVIVHFIIEMALKMGISL